MSIEYSFPEAFIEGVEGDKYIVENTSGYILVGGSKQIHRGRRLFGHVPYEKTIELAVDLVKPVITNSIIVIPHYTGEEIMNGVLVEKDTKPCLMEVKGSSPLLQINEGSMVEEGDRIGLVLTGKGEVHNVFSPCSGRVVLIVNYTWEKPEKYIIVVVGEDEAREIRIRKG